MTHARTLAIVCSGLLAASAGCKKKDPPQGGGGSAPTTPVPATGGGSAGGAAATPAATGWASAPDKRIVVKDAGFATPESVLHDAAADVYLVANINGSPAAADDNGFISKVTPDGKVAELKWIDGGKPDVKLDAPKGMAISGGVLWVADITVVRRFDAKTGAQQPDVEVPGATFLNDVTAGEDGGIYVGDTGVDAKFEPAGTDAVYQITKDGKVKPRLRSRDLGGPNGLAFASGSLWVVSFGSGELYEVTARGEKKPGVKLPKGRLDGIVAKGDGELLISSWEGRAVYAGKPGGDFRVVLGEVEAPADIGWDGKRNVLLVPQFTDHALILLPL